MKNYSLRRVSPSTEALLARLNGWWRSPAKWIGWGDVPGVLEQIGNSKEPLAIPFIMSFGIVGNERIRAQALSAIHRLFSSLPIEFLPLLDEALRPAWIPEYSWHGMTAEQIPALPKSSDAELLYLNLMSCHQSGYVRAAALQTLSAESTATSIPFILSRLVDWVREVRLAAEIALRNKLNPIYGDEFVRCLGLIGRLARNSRYRPEFTVWVEDLLRSRECAESLRRGLSAESKDVRRRCYRIAVSSPSFPFRDAILHAIADDDVVVRRWAFELATSRPGEDHDAFRRKAAEDPYGPIRRMALEAYLDRETIEPGELERYLYDRSATNRHLCQRAFSERLGLQPAEFYRAAIRDHAAKQPAICIQGLAETGNPGDAILVAGALQRSSSRVRRVAVQALGALGVGGHEQGLCQLVSSDVLSVARVSASTLLEKRAVPAEAVWAAALENPDAKVHRGVLRLLRSTGKWQQLGYYLRAADSNDSDFLDCAIELMNLWVEKFNETFTPVSEGEALQLLKMLECVRLGLPVDLARQVEFILQRVSQ
ncbi:HEAT repeat domain-containing protein [Paludibaculum fermentans]|uniref:HEAT repeat domain-containing protein n=1 Tax=Paludibaculum fermentans TaxID=1473598 RepID=A0A7S7NWN7_PALFE|nr:hypothetical protein [Paludibaculum fermentans]QOY91144.1 hypothetical protein IRI77_14710 [Paludibaculum fermentans]